MINTMTFIVNLQSIKLRIKPSIPWALLLIIVTFSLFSEMYSKLVVQIFNFGGMSYDPREGWFIELALLIVCQFFLAYRVKTPSELYNWTFFIILLIPATVLSASQGSDRYYLFLMFSALWLSMFFCRLFSHFLHRESVVDDKDVRKLPYYSIFGVVLLTLLFLAFSVRGVFNLNFSEVYERRFNISENMPLVLRYLMPMASGALVGYLSALSTHRRHGIGMLLIAIIGILFFGFSSHKAMLFHPLIAIAGYFLFKMSRPYLLILFGFSIITLIILFIPSDEPNLLVALFANRIVFIPSQINFVYFDFFTTNSFMLWAESKVSLGFVTSPLPMPVMNYIGGQMTGNYDIGANTGWMANAYMNAGIVGVVIYSAVVGFIFALIDSWAKIYGAPFVGAAFLVPVVTIILTADLLIVLLTGGLSVLLFIFFLSTMRLPMIKKISAENQPLVIYENA